MIAHITTAIVSGIPSFFLFGSASKTRLVATIIFVSPKRVIKTNSQLKNGSLFEVKISKQNLSKTVVVPVNTKIAINKKIDKLAIIKEINVIFVLFILLS